MSSYVINVVYIAAFTVLSYKVQL